MCRAGAALATDPQSRPSPSVSCMIACHKAAARECLDWGRLPRSTCSPSSAQRRRTTFCTERLLGPQKRTRTNDSELRRMNCSYPLRFVKPQDVQKIPDFTLAVSAVTATYMLPRTRGADCVERAEWNRRSPDCTES
jgi:hypothetical protein